MRQCFEIMTLFRFQTHRLCGFSTKDAFTVSGCDFRIDLTRQTITIKNLLLKYDTDVGQEWHDYQDHHGQLPIDHQHHDTDPKNQGQTPYQVDDRPGNDIRQTTDITGQTCHDPTLWGLIKIGEGLFLKFTEGLITDVISKLHFDLTRKSDKDIDHHGL